MSMAQVPWPRVDGRQGPYAEPWALYYRHFDKDKSGRLNHQEFKSCLRSLGYDLPMVEEGEPDPEFEAILDTVDPNR